MNQSLLETRRRIKAISMPPSASPAMEKPQPTGDYCPHHPEEPLFRLLGADGRLGYMRGCHRGCCFPLDSFENWGAY